MNQAQRLVSPNEMMGAAKEMMLEGRDPVNLDEEMLLVNFLAVNIGLEIEGKMAAIKLFARMYPEDFKNIEDWQITQIVAFQERQTQGRG